MQKLYIKISSCSPLVKRFCTELLMLDEFNLDMRNWTNCRFGLNSSMLARTLISFTSAWGWGPFKLQIWGCEPKDNNETLLCRFGQQLWYCANKTFIIDMASQPERVSSPLPIAIRLLLASEFSCSYFFSFFFLKRLIILIDSITHRNCWIEEI